MIPVRDNDAGARRLVASIAAWPRRPRDVIVVDSASARPLTLPPQDGLHVIRVDISGPARARNAGWRASRGEWILFVDSDCIVDPALLDGFISAANGAVAYAGEVRAFGTDLLSRYYDAQKTLVPPPTEDRRPAYLVTANALVWRQALEHVAGFDERFPFPGGEDIDLAYRLREAGELSYAPDAIVLHDFEPGLTAFVRRFVRYGRGNRLLERVHGTDHRPVPFRPAANGPLHHAAAALQYAAMLVGYALEGRRVDR